MLSSLVILEPSPSFKGLHCAVCHTVRLTLLNCWDIEILEATIDAIDGSCRLVFIIIVQLL